MDMEQVLRDLGNLLIPYALNVIGAIAILVIGRFVAGIVSRLVKRAMGKADVDETLGMFFGRLAYVFVIIFSVVAALAKFGIQTTSFVAVLGAAGFAVGFALQGSLSNFAAGVLILVLRPYRIGDYIKGGGTEGTVKDIHLFVTELATLDNIKVLVPNNALLGSNIEVLTGYEQRRVLCPIGISYGSNIGHARDVAIEVMKADSRVLDSPAPDVVVTEWGDSSVNMAAVFWCDPNDYWGVFFDMNRRLKEAFDDNDIEIPFPQRVIHNAA
jgi:small conductance mechanosensitive channel